jgi:DNA-binding LacI/PurR family transcriptional regulator
VPDDISIIGCSDSVMAQYVDPPLTTIHLPYRKMGGFAAEQLLGRLAGKAPAGPHFLDFHLVERASVRPL